MKIVPTKTSEARKLVADAKHVQVQVSYTFYVNVSQRAILKAIDAVSAEEKAAWDDPNLRSSSLFGPPSTEVHEEEYNEYDHQVYPRMEYDTETGTLTIE